MGALRLSVALSGRRRGPRQANGRIGPMPPSRSPRLLASVAALALAAVALACAGNPDEPAGREPARPLSLTSLDPPAGPGAMAPRLAPGPGGPHLTWLEPIGEAELGAAHKHRLLLARLQGEGGAGQWSAPVELARGEGFFANWADLPGVAASESQVVGHWLEKLGEATYAYGVQLTHWRDDGSTWEPTGLLHDDDSPQEHGFVSWVALPDGSLRAFWLDGREMGGEEGATAGHGGHDGHGGGPMQLRTTRVVDGVPEPSELLDPKICECCPTGAAMTSRGPLVVYRGRSDQEIRDIRIVRAEGESWSAPSLVHADGWEIHGCPVNGPAVAAEGDRVAVAWFTGAEGRARVLLAFSEDAGESFGEPLKIDGQSPLGRVDVAMAADGGALVSWMASGEDGAELRLRHAAPDGSLGPPGLVTATTAQRSAGIPRMLRYGDALLFVWVEDAQPSRLRAATMPEAASSAAAGP
jgi:hypothetical protein